MTFDVDLPDSKRFAHYGPDDEKAGEMILDELAALIGGSGKVAVLAGNPDAPNLFHSHIIEQSFPRKTPGR